MIEYFSTNASSFAGDIDFLFNLITGIVGFWFVLVLAVTVYFMARFRRRPKVKAAYITGEVHTEQKWLHTPHNIIIGLDVILIVFTIMIWIDIKQTLPPPEKVIRVIGQQWSWFFIHSGSDGKLDTEDDITISNDLHVIKDTVYHFELQSRDVIHNFSVPAFRLRQDIIPGRTITGWFEPTKAGAYDIQCAEMCGLGHGIMGATIVVHDNQEAYDQTMVSIQNGTYKSHFQRRLREMTIRPQEQVSQQEPFTDQLLSSFSTQESEVRLEKGDL